MNDNYFSLYKNIIIKIIKKNKILYKSYFQKHKNHKYSLSFILDEIFYVLKTGIPWRLVRSFINWNTLYFHFNRLSKYNIFKKTFYYIRNNFIKSSNSSYTIVDSTFIQNKFGKNKIGRNKFFKNKNCNKISFITDDKGIPISIYKENIHDIKFMDYHINDFFILNNKKKVLLADKAYHSKKLYRTLSNKNVLLYVQNKKNSNIFSKIDNDKLKKRIVIENTFQRLKVFRRIMTRYDKLFSNYSSFFYFGSSLLFKNNLINLNYIKIL